LESALLLEIAIAQILITLVLIAKHPYVQPRVSIQEFVFHQMFVIAHLVILELIAKPHIVLQIAQMDYVLLYPMERILVIAKANTTEHYVNSPCVLVVVFMEHFVHHQTCAIVVLPLVGQVSIVTHRSALIVASIMVCVLHQTIAPVLLHRLYTMEVCARFQCVYNLAKMAEIALILNFVLVHPNGLEIIVKRKILAILHVYVDFVIMSHLYVIALVLDTMVQPALFQFATA